MASFARARLFAVALVSNLIVPAAVRSAPQIGLSWNQCDVLETTHPVVGADRIAHLFVYVEGLGANVTGFDLAIRINPSFGYNCACGSSGTLLPPAWSFEAGGCQGPDRVRASLGPVDSGCESLAAGGQTFGSPVIARDSSYCFGGTCGTSWGSMSLLASSYHSWVLSAPTRTAVWRLDFDLSRSCAFAPPGSECCPDDMPMALFVTGSAVLADLSTVDLGQARVDYSAEAVPSRPASWGSIKATYR